MSPIFIDPIFQQLRRTEKQPGMNDLPKSGWPDFLPYFGKAKVILSFSCADEIRRLL
jgi:hypothetical protein